MRSSLATLLVLTIFTSTVHARFAEFVRIAPGFAKADRCRAYISTNPVVTIAQSDTNTLTITIPIKGTRQHQQYWLIRCKSPLRKGQMNFRNYVWGIDKRSDIEKSEGIQIKPGQESLSYQVPAEAIGRTYLYRDYPKLVVDGGYYYCFDLPGYYKKHQAEQPAAQVQSEGAPSD